MIKMPCVEYFNPMKNYLFLKGLGRDDLGEYFVDGFASWTDITIKHFIDYS